MRAPGRAPCWWAARGSHASRRASWRPTPAGAGRTSTCNNAIAWARCASWQTKPCAAKRRARRTHGTPPANPPTPPAPRPHGPDSPGTGALTAWRPRRAGNRPHPPVAAHAPGRPGTTYTTSPVTPDTDLDLPREDLAPTTKPGTGLAAQPTLRDELAADLDIPVAQLDEHTSLIQLGMDSMHLMAWLNRLRQRGHEVTLRQLYGEPTPAGWSRLLQQKAGGGGGCGAGGVGGHGGRRGVRTDAGAARLLGRPLPPADAGRRRLPPLPGIRRHRPFRPGAGIGGPGADKAPSDAARGLPQRWPPAVWRADAVARAGPPRSAGAGQQRAAGPAAGPAGGGGGQVGGGVGGGGGRAAGRHAPCARCRLRLPQLSRAVARRDRRRARA